MNFNCFVISRFHQCGPKKKTRETRWHVAEGGAVPVAGSPARLVQSPAGLGPQLCIRRRLQGHALRVRKHLLHPRSPGREEVPAGQGAGRLAGESALGSQRCRKEPPGTCRWGGCTQPSLGGHRQVRGRAPRGRGHRETRALPGGGPAASLGTLLAAHSLGLPWSFSCT